MLSPGVATGQLVGGCLRLICDSLGTPDEIDTSGKILLVEDVDEAPHRVDAMFTHLLNAGKLQQIAGIVVGGFSATDEKRNQGTDSPTWREIVRERLSGITKPTIIDFPIGHKAENATYPLGVDVELDADARRLECLKPGARSD
jgi:muramoyltetrapeptide carboxypeptidase